MTETEETEPTEVVEVRHAQDLQSGDIAYCNYMISVEGSNVRARTLVGAWVLVDEAPQTASGSTVRFQARPVEADADAPVRMVELLNEAPIPVLVIRAALHAAPPEVLASELSQLRRDFTRAQDRLRVLEDVMGQVQTIVEDLVTLDAERVLGEASSLEA